MAIYGFGAAYSGTEDMTSAFIKAGGAFVGWKRTEAPAAHAMLRQIEIGDVAFLKSFPPSTGLIVKAVGLVTEAGDDIMDWEIGTGVKVSWAFVGARDGGTKLFGKIGDKADFTRGGTLYREYNPEVQRRIVALILSN